MADYEVRIQLNADTGPAQAGIRTVNRNLESMGPAAQRGIRMADREARTFQTSLTNVGRAAMGMMTAFAASQVVQVVGQLRQMGSEAERLQRTFEGVNLGDAIADRQAMDRLKELTSGMLTETELAREAVGYMLSGVASDAEEAGEIVKLALEIGGRDGLAAMRSAIMNQSIEVLDTLNINSSRVRELRDQYKAAGMEAGEAYFRAVMEVGNETRDAMGDTAIAAAMSNWDRLQVHIQDGIDDLARRVNFLAELISGSLLELIDEANSPSGLQLDELIRGMSVTGILSQIATRTDTPEVRTSYASFGTGAVAQAEINAERDAVMDMLNAQARAARLNTDTLMRLAQDTQRGVIDGVMLFSREDLIFAQSVADEAERIVESFKGAEAPFSESAITQVERVAETAREWRDLIAEGVEAFESITMPDLFGQTDGGLLGELGGTFLDRMRGVLPDDEFASLQDALGLRTGELTHDALAWRDEALPALEQIYSAFGRDAALTALEAYEQGARTAFLQGDPIGDPLTLMNYIRVGGTGGGYTVRPDDGHYAIASGLGMSVDDLYARGILRPGQVVHPGESYGGGGLMMRHATSGWMPPGLDASADDVATIYPTTEAQELADSMTIAAEQFGIFKDNAITAKGPFDDITASLDTSLLRIQTMGTEVATISQADYELRFKLVGDSSAAPPWLVQLIDSRLTQITLRNGGQIPGSFTRTRD